MWGHLTFLLLVSTVPSVPSSFSLVLCPHRHSSLVLVCHGDLASRSYDRVGHKYPHRLASCWSHTPPGCPSCLPSHSPHILTTCPFPQAPSSQLQNQAWPHAPKEGHLCLMRVPARPGTAVLCQAFAPRSQRPRGGLGQAPSPA